MSHLIKNHAYAYAKTNVKIHITQTCPFNILQYFTVVKKGNFQIKNVIFFLIFAQNIDRGYTLEPPQ